MQRHAREWPLRKAELVCLRFLRKESPLSTGVNRGHSEGRWDGEDDGGSGICEGRAGSIKHAWGTELWPTLTGAKPAPRFGPGKS